MAYPAVEPLPDVAAARDHVAARALRDSTVGAVGLELESHLVATDRPADRPSWPEVLNLVGALPATDGPVTVEPGGQLELSGPPGELVEAVESMRRDLRTVRAALPAHRLAPIGTDPVRPSRRINPAERYVAMERHFASVDCAGPGVAMMASTAALQVNLDAGPRAGWAQRVGLAHRLGPTLIAVSACSPLLAGAETGWRSSRQWIWNELDQRRCGPLLGRVDPAEEWADYALCAPVMRVPDGPPVDGRVSFADWVSGAVPLGGRRPTVADLDYHLTTLFPPIRLRGFLEIRYLDAAPDPWWPALAAVVATLLDDPVAADQAADAVAPVAERWLVAARDGLADPELHRAARRCLHAAAGRVPPPLKAEVHALAELVDAGRCPGDDLLAVARRSGPVAALLAGAQEGS